MVPQRYARSELDPGGSRKEEVVAVMTAQEQDNLDAIRRPPPPGPGPAANGAGRPASAGRMRRSRGGHHQRGQKRQLPSVDPPIRYASGLTHCRWHHHLVVLGPHRIPIPPLGRNLPAPASLHGLVNAGSVDEPRRPATSSNSARLQRRPLGAVEHVRSRRAAQSLRADRWFAGRQDRSHGQELGFAPGPGQTGLKGQPGLL